MSAVLPEGLAGANSFARGRFAHDELADQPVFRE
jgi:hypothetical protein